jgi:hypothetical protein
MADGATSHALMADRRSRPRLSAALAPRSSLWATCRCGREAVIDPRAWISQGLSRQATDSLEDRLRCLCGARRARLEIRGLAEAPSGMTGGIHVFR